MYTHPSYTQRSVVTRHVARTCVQPATFKRTRERVDWFIRYYLFSSLSPFLARPLAHSKYPLFFSRRGPEGSPAKRSCYATGESGPVDSYGACASRESPIGKSVAIFHCPTRRCIRLSHPPPPPSFSKKVYLHHSPLLSICTLTTQARAHFVCRDNVFIIHWIIHCKRWRKSGGGAVLRDTVGHVETWFTACIARRWKKSTFRDTDTSGYLCRFVSTHSTPLLRASRDSRTVDFLISKIEYDEYRDKLVDKRDKIRVRASLFIELKKKKLESARKRSSSERTHVRQV